MENRLIALLPRERYSVAVRYLGTLVIVGVATLLRLSLAEELQHYPVLLFIPAVFLSALLFDRGSGFFATIVSALIAIYLFIEPAGSFDLDIREFVPLSIFVGVGFAISAVMEALRRAIDKLSRAEAQKSLLLEELGHRTKNDLFMVSSVLKLQARAQKDPKIRSALEAAVARVAVIARAQERLRGDKDGGTVELAGYLEDLCHTLGDMLRNVRPIAVVVNLARVEVSSSDAVSIGLIVNELVTNAFKYAFPQDRGGTVKVTLSRHTTGLELVVEDDGVGCPPEPSQGMGSRLVRLLAAQMQGELRRDADHAGCKTIVSLPIERLA
ncbi:sensor histidine kinase [Bradyrhizobium sp. HKCCYLS1011]|uniref:sensor histidine kinase n=1 Tax=Bradyrhizobium sp. HKCCYLS1011 TaxID=3420733 RepID=UPI003EBE792D